MKKYIIAILLLSFGIPNLMAQSESKVSATVLGGYTYDTDVPLDYGSVTIKGGFTFGVELAFKPSEQFQIELTYSNQNSNTDLSYVNLYAPFNQRNENISTSTQYIMVGGTANFIKSDDQKLIPFAGLHLGMAYIVDQSDIYSTQYRFALDGKLGVNYFFNEVVGIQAKIQLDLAMAGYGGSFYVGTGGSGVALSAYSTAFQFSTMGGLVFNLGAKK